MFQVVKEALRLRRLAHTAKTPIVRQQARKKLSAQIAVMTAAAYRQFELEVRPRDSAATFGEIVEDA